MALREVRGCAAHHPDVPHIGFHYENPELRRPYTNADCCIITFLQLVKTCQVLRGVNKKKVLLKDDTELIPHELIQTKHIRTQASPTESPSLGWCLNSVSTLPPFSLIDEISPVILLSL